MRRFVIVIAAGAIAAFGTAAAAGTAAAGAAIDPIHDSLFYCARASTMEPPAP